MFHFFGWLSVLSFNSPPGWFLDFWKYTVEQANIYGINEYRSNLWLRRIKSYHVNDTLGKWKCLMLGWYWDEMHLHCVTYFLLMNNIQWKWPFLHYIYLYSIHIYNFLRSPVGWRVGHMCLRTLPPPPPPLDIDPWAYPNYFHKLSFYNKFVFVPYYI